MLLLIMEHDYGTTRLGPYLECVQGVCNAVVDHLVSSLDLGPQVDGQPWHLLGIRE